MTGGVDQVAPETLFTQARALVSAGRHGEATAIVERILELQPDSFDASSLQADIYYSLGHWSRAEAAFAGLAARRPDFLAAAYKRGYALGRLGRNDEALKCFERVLAGNPGHVDSLVHRGNALLALGRADEALDNYRHALNINSVHTDAANGCGAALHQQGRTEEAISWYRRAIEFGNGNAAAHRNLALILLAMGRLEECLESFAAVLAGDPDNLDAINGSAVALLRLGRCEESVQACRRALSVRPDCSAAANNLGAALRPLGRLKEAEQAFRDAMACDTGNLEASFNLAALLATRTEFPEAIAMLRNVLSVRPDFFEAAMELGNILFGRKDWIEAERRYRQAIEARPANAEPWYSLGNALHEQDRIPQAIDAYLQCLKLKPESAGAENNLANLLTQQGRYEEAFQAFQRALRLQPEYHEAASNLGLMFLGIHHLEEAEVAFRQAIALRPDEPEYLNNLGCVLQALGRVDEAEALYQRAVELDPRFIKGHTNLLTSAHYRPGITLAELARIHREWDVRYASGLCDAWCPGQEDRTTGRPIRVGFVSPDLCRHPVGYFVIRVIEAMDRTRFSTFCYSDRSKHDDLTARFIAAAHTWREVRRLSHEQLVQTIRDDRIDVLFDLAGHTGGNRMLAFARRAAPVQISWAGYFGTTGLAEMDFVVADRYQVPAGGEKHFREEILYMPGSYVTYDPPAYAPEVAPLPALTAGYVTFGSFSNLAKINLGVVRVWARLLERVPRSRLLLKFRGLQGENRQRYLRLFEDAGVAADRLDLEGFAPHAELLGAYNRVDIGLDPFPYSGGLTTCEALWMGVPVLTCPGETFASRHTLGYLSVVGVPDFVATDLEDYVERAVMWASSLERLASLRRELRHRVERSSLCDGPAFVQALEGRLRGILGARKS